MKFPPLAAMLSSLLVLASGPALAQPIRDVPGTVPAPVPTVPALPPGPNTTPPEQTERLRGRTGDSELAPPRDRSGGATDAGPSSSTPYSGVPERGDPATGASGLGR